MCKKDDPPHPLALALLKVAIVFIATTLEEMFHSRLSKQQELKMDYGYAK